MNEVVREDKEQLGERGEDGNLIRPAEGDRVKRKNRNRTQHDNT